jgi:DNA-binding GntR family transcriptional regulator
MSETMATGGVPRYAQIAALIRDRIIAGELGIGDRAPSENEISDEYDVARQTASHALNLLAAEGVLERRIGTGSIVIAVPERTEIHCGPGAQIHARMPSRAEIRGGMPPGEPVLVIRRPGQAEEVHPAGRAVVVTVSGGQSRG